MGILSRQEASQASRVECADGLSEAALAFVVEKPSYVIDSPSIQCFPSPQWQEAAQALLTSGCLAAHLPS